MASMDLDEANYTASRQNLYRSLRINQEIRNVAGEASNLYQLGSIAWETGKKVEAIRLVVVSFAILKKIKDSNAKHVGENLHGMLEDLELSKEQQRVMGRMAWESYLTDGGDTLLREAFGIQT